MASTDARPVPIKNTAFRAVFPILDADGDLVTGAAGLDSETSLDQGAFADCTNEATEIATASGMYYLDLTAGEMNGDCVAVIVKTSTGGAKTTVLVFYPEETGDINVDVTAWLGTAAATPTVAGVPEVDLTHVAGATTNVAALATNVDAILTDTGTTLDGRIPAVLVGGRMDANVGAISADAIAADNLEAALDGTGGVTITAALTGNVTGNLSGSVGSVTGAVGSVTGAVGSVGAGGIAAASFAAGAIDASAIAADAIGSSELAATAAGEIADAIWDEATSGHTTGGSYGDKLGAHLPAVLKLVVGTGSTTTAVVFSTVDGAAPSATNDFYNGRVIVFTSGTLAGQATSISDYVGATVTATVVATTGAPANTDTAVIV